MTKPRPLLTFTGTLTAIYILGWASGFSKARQEVRALQHQMAMERQYRKDLSRRVEDMQAQLDGGKDG